MDCRLCDGHAFLSNGKVCSRVEASAVFVPGLVPMKVARGASDSIARARGFSFLTRQLRMDAGGAPGSRRVVGALPPLVVLPGVDASHRGGLVAGGGRWAVWGGTGAVTQGLEPFARGRILPVSPGKRLFRGRARRRMRVAEALRRNGKVGFSC